MRIGFLIVLSALRQVREEGAGLQLADRARLAVVPPRRRLPAGARGLQQAAGQGASQAGRSQVYQHIFSFPSIAPDVT